MLGNFPENFQRNIFPEKLHHWCFVWHTTAVSVPVANYRCSMHHALRVLVNHLSRSFPSRLITPQTSTAAAVVNNTMFTWRSSRQLVVRPITATIASFRAQNLSYPGFQWTYLAACIAKWNVTRVTVSCVNITEETAHGFIVNARLQRTHHSYINTITIPFEN